MKNFFEEFKTPIVTAIIIMIAFFVYTKTAGPIPFLINSITTNQTNLFSASGEGEATAVPDQATVNAGVTAQGTTVADAQNKANSQSQKIINALKALGIPESDIKTTNYSVMPNYGGGEPVPMIYPQRPGNNITGYTVTQNLEINVKDLSKVNKTIDAATQNGANLVGGTNFTFSDALKKKLENQARQQAVTDAKQKAQGLADAAGIHLGRVVNVVENLNGLPQPLSMKAASAGTTDQSAPTNVTPGENTISIDVVIYYETY